MSISLDLNQTRHSVWPDQGPDLLQRLSADITDSQLNDVNSNEH